jgi:alkylated DNA nucleotide flippase Atl1
MVAARTTNVVHAARRPAADTRRATRASSRKAWADRLRPDLLPEIVADRRHGDRLLLPTPLLLAEVIAQVPRGATITMTQLRDRLARRFGADRSCPLMTGTFVRILAGVVKEDLAQRRQARWPIWRLVGDDGRLSTTWPLDDLYRATRLREEGVTLGHARGAWQVRAPGLAPGLATE